MIKNKQEVAESFRLWFEESYPFEGNCPFDSMPRISFEPLQDTDRFTYGGYTLVEPNTDFMEVAAVQGGEAARMFRYMKNKTLARFINWLARVLHRIYYKWGQKVPINATTQHIQLIIHTPPEIGGPLEQSASFGWKFHAGNVKGRTSK